MRKILAAVVLALGCAAHAELCVKKGEAIAFMGDSITDAGNVKPVGYVNLVMHGLKLFGAPFTKKIPAGVSGNKSVQMRARLEKDVLSKKPQWMTFSCGVNDVWHGKNGVPLDKYKTLVGEIFDECDKAGVKVIVLTATMITENPEHDFNKKLKPYNQWLREEAKRRKYPLADLNADMHKELARIRLTDKSQGNKLTGDGVHMDFAGDVLMAWGVLRAMGVEENCKDKFVEMCRNIPNAHRVDIPLSVAEKEKLDALSKAKNMNPREYIRSTILK